ncbi:MAG: beta-ketoacyl-[acyl-carrier-protein] synthase family protein [Planctomycetes bacterium]|nr:beta-ketoacyl-[acyl-carrier-protein] synthase family protein [Planctomycetota bacterium]
MNTGRVVITGIGAISPLGLNVSGLWEGLCGGKCGIATIQAFDPVGFTCRLAGEVAAFKIRKHVPKSHRKATKLMCRDIQLAIVAAEEAIADAGIITKATDPANINFDPPRMAINVGAGVICCNIEELSPAIIKSVTDGKFDLRKFGTAGIEAVTPLWLLKYLPNMLACHIGIIHDIQGPSNSITCGEAGGQIAIGEAVEVIQRGGADLALAGGCEAKVNPIVMLRQCLLGRSTSENNDDPDGACRPFGAEAKGSVFGEGGGMVVLETIEHAQERGAKIYAEVAGSASSNAVNIGYSHIEPDGKGIEIAIEAALAEAGIDAGQLDLIIPHGTGIPADDRAEATAIANVLARGTAGAKDAPVWPTKGMLSHTGAGAGAIDVVSAAKTIAEGKTGIGKNCDNKAEGCELNIITEPIEKDFNYVLCCSYTFGGQTAAVVLKRI